MAVLRLARFPPAKTGVNALWPTFPGNAYGQRGLKAFRGNIAGRCSGGGMATLIEVLRSGAWLTRARMRRWALAVLVAAAAGLGFLVATADGVIDLKGRPLGTDFSNVYAAGRHVLEGHATAAFDPALQYRREQALFGADTPFYGWHYPPFFLFVAAPLALMPYALALAVWQAATLALYLLAMHAMAATAARTAPAAMPAGDRLWLLLAIAFPAVLVNLGHGHNGFLTAALITSGLILLDRRPAMAGLLFGLIAYKPQFGLVIPLVLVATGRWRAVAAAATTVVALALAATVAFGSEIWVAFLASTRFTREIVLEAGDTGWHKIQSVFSWIRLWGGSITLAYAVQGAVAAAVAIAATMLWRSRATAALKAAVVPLAAMLATPYALDYDMMVLAPAIGFFAVDGLSRGFRAYEKTALAALWMVPILARTVTELTLVPVGVITMLLTFVLLIRRADDAPRPAPAPLGSAA
jgi:alpha-1,2-mannosyltransferase